MAAELMDIVFAAGGTGGVTAVTTVALVRADVKHLKERISELMDQLKEVAAVANEARRKADILEARHL